MNPRYLRAERRPAKLRMYQRIWNLIAENTSDQPVKITCPVNNHKRLIQAVRKEKTIANMARKNVDAVSYGELVIAVDGTTIAFSLKYNGDMI